MTLMLTGARTNLIDHNEKFTCYNLARKVITRIQINLIILSHPDGRPYKHKPVMERKLITVMQNLENCIEIN